MPFHEAPPAPALTPVRSNADIDAYVVQSPGSVGGSGRLFDGYYLGGP